jgi:hypothetical protein
MDSQKKRPKQVKKSYFILSGFNGSKVHSSTRGPVIIKKKTFYFFHLYKDVLKWLYLQLYVDYIVYALGYKKYIKLYLFWR